MATSLFFFLFSIFSSTAFGSCLTLLNAAEILSNSGYLSMSLTLKIASEAIKHESPTATVFAPADQAFVKSGQPSLLLLRRHVSPIKLSFETLKSLPRGSRIPTMVPDHSLVVTASLAIDGFISINNVRINEKAVFGDGFVALYGIDEFINSSFVQTEPGQPAPAPASLHGSTESFAPVAQFLRSRGYHIMATLLDAQLTGLRDQTKLTIFAPVDRTFDYYASNISDYALIFRRHVVPRLLTWQDLIGSELVGTKLPTFSRGFMIDLRVSSDGIPMLNDAPVVFQDIYQSDRFIVHGLNGLLKPFTDQEWIQDSFSDGFVGDESHG
ncbi:putative fasciclin-like arabinogalactan protein 20 [Humulus lupulus]|uniref:putative fasciclin-like arabinogalactan protein 20 n=1 Tax=Humulus lupulus TaxID=3486 RepID=UPI002B40B78C|nr:putative fasciclin-like arabinogalactan protein 20 [Humulus lupulus]